MGNWLLFLSLSLWVSYSLGDDTEVGTPSCSAHDNCPATKACIQGRCEDPCDGLCGDNTTCTVRNHIPACACKDGYTGNAFHGCTEQQGTTTIPHYITNSIFPEEQASCQQHCKLLMIIQEAVFSTNTDCFVNVVNGLPDCECNEGFVRNVQHQCVAEPGCQTDSNCPEDQICHHKKCIDPCEEAACGNNTICSVKNHLPHCECKEGFVANVHRQCVQPDCQIDSNCPEDQVCRQQKCIDPCKEAACGNNTICYVKNHLPHCRCKDGFIESVHHQCDQVDCETDSNCPKDQICRQGECMNPCKEAVCGDNGICSVINHLTHCNCKEGFEVNVHGQCVQPDCQSHSNCPEDQVCRQGECIDPCKEAACGDNGFCHVVNHITLCGCNSVFSVNVRGQCVPEVDCQTDSNCPYDQMCRQGKCMNPCKEGDCGDNGVCNVANHIAYCKCKQGFIVDAHRQCSLYRF